MSIIHTESGLPPRRIRMVAEGGFVTGVVGAGGTSDKVFTPPMGVMWRLKMVWLGVSAPAGAASGTHKFAVRNSSSFDLITGESNFGLAVEFKSSVWGKADSYTKPTTEDAVLAAINSVVFDHEHPITIRYSNNTNVSNAAGRDVYISVEETQLI